MYVSANVVERERECGGEQNSEGEPEDVSREKRICDHTQNLGQILSLKSVSEKNTEGCA